MLREKNYHVEILNGFTIIFIPTEDNGYDTLCLEVDFLKGSGKTLEDARSFSIGMLELLKGPTNLSIKNKQIKGSKEIKKINEKALQKVDEIENSISDYIKHIEAMDNFEFTNTSFTQDSYHLDNLE